MAPPGQEGPDGSSIRPVSSLLAKFENLNKPSDSQSQPAPPNRTASPSPAPKPDRFRDPGALGATAPPSVRPEPPAVPRTRPRDKAYGAPPVSNNNTTPAATATTIAALSVPGSALSRPVSPSRSSTLTSPIRILAATPPSLTVEPPQSPPRNNVDVAVGERPVFTDSLVKSASPAGALKNFKIPSRPPTPLLEQPLRSPHLVPSQPPSPPPPRRSAELRRERESKEAAKTGVPPPVYRSEKPSVLQRSPYLAEGGQALEWKSRASVAVTASPLNSPPSSHGSHDEDDGPPVLPSRPRPQMKAIETGFDPPPLHPSLANRRREKEEPNGATKPLISPMFLSGEPRSPAPALPHRPHSVVEPLRPPNVAGMPPPRPPRLGLAASPEIQSATSSSPPKRVSSTPTQHLAPPPARRNHGRSMTIDRTSDRTPIEFREPVGVTNDLRATDVLIAGARIDPLASSAAAAATTTTAAAAAAVVYPDIANTTRNKPYLAKAVHEIPIKYDSRIFDVCGDLVCTTGTYTRAWAMLDGELRMSLAMGEGIKGTAVAFRPGANVDEEGDRIWTGNNYGELMEADINTSCIINTKANAHGRNEVIKIYRCHNELWTLDEAGTLHVWGPDETGVPSLTGAASQTFRVPRGHTFSMVVEDQLWHATGREIRVFLPTVDGTTQFQVLVRPLVHEGAGDVTAGSLVTSEPDKVIFGHVDGKVTLYSRKDYTCLGVVAASSSKINTLAGVGDYLWAGYSTGKIAVYDMSSSPWALKKEWQAHESQMPVGKLIADPSGLYRLDRYQVVSLGADNMLRTWDGLLQDDWLENEMKGRDAEYCDFDTLKGLAMTWNAGASTPNSLRYSGSDVDFFQNLLQSGESPDILVFGFQELVDLEDKTATATATAKQFLKRKKKEAGSDQECMSHQYRDWRDFLIRCLDDSMAGELYQLLHSAPLVGLFTCIFVKADLRDRVSGLSVAEVKRGMGGFHGNKGAIAVRFLVDDTSFCFINCHLAAGQSGANARNGDIAAILEAPVFPPAYRGPDSAAELIDRYAAGGDGTMILDHELCVLNGDLNYRIDTMSRDTVVAAVKTGNLAKLLERDQLLVARRRRPEFRLRAFDERPITFAPTYKYDVGTDNYDTSEKRRSPAWCDRLLFRSWAAGAGGAGKDRIEQLDYHRHEVRVSDHRPVSGRLRFTTKRVNAKKRAVTWMQCQQRWQDARERMAGREILYYLTRIIGYDAPTAQMLIKERGR